MELLKTIAASVGRIETAVAKLTAQGVIVQSDLTALTAQVALNTSVEGSALVLINGFAAQLAAAGTDPVALAALDQELATSATALAAAVSANTPVVAAPPAPASTGNVAAATVAKIG